MFPSVRSFLAFSYTILALLVILILGVGIQLLVESRLRSALDADLRARGEQVTDFVLSDTDSDLTEQVRRYVEGVSPSGQSGDATYLRLYDPSGEALPLGRSSPEPPLPPTAPQELRRLRAPVIETAISADGTPFRVLTRRVTFANQPLAYVQVARSLAGVNGITTQLRNALLVGGLLAGLVVATLSYLLAYQALKPFSAIVEDTRHIGAEDLDRRLPASYGVDEVSRLAQTFNGLLDRLQKAFDLQRRFVADASHELRTPLTTIRGNVDVLLLDPDLPAYVREALQNVSAESARLGRLVTNLLLLARAEAGQSGPPPRPVDLHALTLETVRQARSMPGSVEVRLEREDQAMVAGDADQLKQVIINLVDNAVKYTPDGGHVWVSVYREGPWAKLEVRDDGIGIAPSDLDRIFDRFYRAERSPKGIGGSGLGLSIVSWVVRAHGGRITVESKLGEGSAFTVCLPLLPVAPETSHPPQFLTRT